MINIQYIKNGSKRIRHVLIDNCMLKSLHRFPTSTSPETSGLLMEKCKLWIEPPSIPFRDRIWGVSFFFLHSCTFFINCKRDRFLRIGLYSGKLHLLIFEKFPFEKNDTNYATCEYPSENQALKICVICWYQIVIITELCE